MNKRDVPRQNASTTMIVAIAFGAAFIVAFGFVVLGGANWFAKSPGGPQLTDHRASSPLTPSGPVTGPSTTGTSGSAGEPPKQ